jgi:hypothetical protein
MGSQIQDLQQSSQDPGIPSYGQNGLKLEDRILHIRDMDNGEPFKARAAADRLAQRTSKVHNSIHLQL